MRVMKSIKKEKGFIFTSLTLLFLSFLLSFGLFFKVLPEKNFISLDYSHLDKAAFAILTDNPTEQKPSNPTNYFCFTIFKRISEEVKICS